MSRNPSCSSNSLSGLPLLLWRNSHISFSASINFHMWRDCWWISYIYCDTLPTCWWSLQSPRILFGPLAGRYVEKIFILGFWHRLGGINAQCQLVSTDGYWTIMWDWTSVTVCPRWRWFVPCRPWMLAPYKGHKDGISRNEYYKNFVQSSTRMCIKRAFGMLKGRWKILLKRVDMHLRNVQDLMSTCMVLHNICIIFGDDFWKSEWM